MKFSCPHCSHGGARPSRWRWFELPLALLTLRPCRCRRCFNRFWRLRFL